jgi:hypothetical protein
MAVPDRQPFELEFGELSTELDRAKKMMDETPSELYRAMAAIVQSDAPHFHPSNSSTISRL